MRKVVLVLNLPFSGTLLWWPQETTQGVRVEAGRQGGASTGQNVGGKKWVDSKTTEEGVQEKL